jgi:hypothetical protein
MKRTNTLSTFWVKAIPVFLLLIGLGITTAHAQNYKPYDEAIASVQTALETLKAPKTVPATLNVSNGPDKTNGMSPAQAATMNVKVFEVSYYQEFLQLTKENQSVAAGVQALDAKFSANGQPQSRATTLTTSRNDLMHLITY